MITEDINCLVVFFQMTSSSKNIIPLNALMISRVEKKRPLWSLPSESQIGHRHTRPTGLPSSGKVLLESSPSSILPAGER